MGAGAAGLLCAITAGKRGRSVLLLDHANKAGKKILMSGGGRCNFTNYHIEPDCFLSPNPHFCKSALARFSQWDFIALVEKHGIPYHEKKLGQLFCDNKAKDIVEMLLLECQQNQVEIKLNHKVKSVEKTISNKSQQAKNLFVVSTKSLSLTTPSLVIATGGLSIPTLGASGVGYQIARQFGVNVLPTRAALVPLTMPEKWLADFSELSGISVDVIVSCGGQSFRENLLFTHRGVSGPAMLQISSYWVLGDEIIINLAPDLELFPWLSEQQTNSPQTLLSNCLSQIFSKKLAIKLVHKYFENKPMNQFSQRELSAIAESLQTWTIKPHGSEGYRTAEVTMGGVDTDQISSKTMEVKHQSGLYFIGEVLDVSGHLGGFNFQWAWASGYVCGKTL